MDINDLKSEWQNASGEAVLEKSLKKMTMVNEHPVLKKLRFKLMTEGVLLTLFLAVYYDGFDGSEKPLYINALLVTSLLLYIGNNLAGYLFIKNPVKAPDIAFSIRMQVNGLKRLSIFSLVSASIYALTLIAFFTISIELTNNKLVLLAIMALTFIMTFYFSFKNWKRRIDHFSSLLEEFGEEP